MYGLQWHAVLTECMLQERHQVRQETGASAMERQQEITTFGNEVMVLIHTATK